MRRIAALLFLLCALCGSASLRFDPPEGRVSLGAGGNPYGLKQIIIYGKELSLNEECRERAAIYLDGAATPAERVGVSEAILDTDSRSALAIVFKGEYREEGSYRVTFPEGFFFSEGVANEPITLDYHIRAGYTVTPPGGTSATSFSEWIVEATDADEIECVTPPAIAPDGTGEVFTLRAEQIAPKRIRLIAEAPISRPGTWRLQINERTFRLRTYGSGYPADPTDVEVSYCDDALLAYNVVTTPKFGISPGEGNIRRLYQFRLLMPEGFELRHAEPTIASSFCLVDSDGFDIEEVARLKCFDAPEPVLTVVDGEGLKASAPLELAPGRYALHLSPDTFYGRYKGIDAGNSSFTYYFEVPRQCFSATIEPVEGSVLPSLDRFTLTFPEADYLSVSEDPEGPAAWLEREGERPECEVRCRLSQTSQGVAVYVEVEPAVTEAGHYRLQFPAGLFIHGRESSPAFGYDFICDGTQGITDAGADRRFDVYTSTGLLVARGVGEDFLRRLPAGVYIAGRRKLQIVPGR